MIDRIRCRKRYNQSVQTVRCVNWLCMIRNTIHTDPTSPLQKLTHTITLTVSCILNSTCVWFCPSQCGLYSFRAHNKAKRVSPVDPGISRGVTDLYPSRGYTHPVTRAIEVLPNAACKLSFDQTSFFWSISLLKCIFSFSKQLLVQQYNNVIYIRF